MDLVDHVSHNVYFTSDRGKQEALSDIYEKAFKVSKSNAIKIKFAIDK